jgi:excinuclease ABC subunit C
VEGANDFAMMEEVLRRRFRHANAPAERDGSPDGPSAAEEAEDRRLRREHDEAMRGAPTQDGSPQRTRERAKEEAWQTLPDLLIVDGGRGQLNGALSVLRGAGLEPIVPAAGLAKRNEELFVKDRPDPIVLPRGSQALFLVQRVRDEAHRFAVTYHRGLRKKSAVQSALDGVLGIGPARKKALLRKFGSVKAVREASLEDIASTAGFTKKLAERVKELV